MAEERPIPQGQGPDEEEVEEEKGSFKLDLYFWTQTLVVAMVAMILIFALFGRLIGVVGSSMVPTLHEGDLLLLQSIGYEPKQGDVVVLRKQSFMNEPVVKRVIAVGGQHVSVDYAEGTVTVDGKVLDEPYINEEMLTPVDAHMNITDIDVPEGSIFVMGDNRNHSTDSRDERLATVDERYVLGRALFVLFPFRDFGAIH